MNIVTTKKDVVWGFLSNFLSMFSNFLILPIFIIFLSSEELGLWYVFFALSSGANLFKFGFAATFSRNINYVWNGAQKLSREGIDPDSQTQESVNYHLLNKTMVTNKLIYSIISLILFVVLVTLGTSYIYSISTDFSGERHIIAWGIFVVSTVTNLYFSHLISFLRGLGLLEKLHKITISTRLLQMAISIVLLMNGFGLIGISLSLLIQSIITTVMYRTVVYKHQNLKQRLNENKGKITFLDIKEMYIIISPNAYRDAIASTANFISTQGSALIVATFFTLEEVASYSISLQIIKALAVISTILIETYKPMFQAAFITGKFEKMQQIAAKGISSFYIIYFTGIIMTIIIGLPIIGLMSTELDLDIFVFLGLSIYMFLWKNQTMFALLIAGTNKLPYVKSFFIGSTLGLVNTVLLIQVFDIGVWSVIIGPMIAQLIYNNWRWPTFMCRELKIPFSNLVLSGFGYWKKYFLKFIKIGKH